jgi:hypothetical protein
MTNEYPAARRLRRNPAIAGCCPIPWRIARAVVLDREWERLQSGRCGRERTAEGARGGPRGRSQGEHFFP